MNNAWIGLEKAPEGSFKNKIHGLVLFCCLVVKLFITVMFLISSFFFCRLGLRLLSRVKPSEIFLKSISKEITSVEIIYPSRLVLDSLFTWLVKGCCLFEVLLLFYYH